ncbi:MAG: putative ABC transport system permease protein [Cyclobacteriaceae bacterium]|jgi:putative ABC transport system permease protein
MLKNYFKIACRNLFKNRIYTLINVLGLALGIGCSLVIFKVLQFETIFDKHHENYDRIYRISSESIYPDRTNKGMGTPYPLGAAIETDYPEILEVARTFYGDGLQINIVQEDGQKEKFLFDEGCAFTENSFFTIFTTKWVAGSSESALMEPNTVVITTSAARRLFGFSDGKESEAMGKIIDNEGDYKVVGIIEDFPETTNFPFIMFFEYSGQKSVNPYFFEGKEWNSTSSASNTYILPNKGFESEAFDQKLVETVEKYYSKEEIERRRFVTQPLSSIHFDKEYGAYKQTISKEFLYALAIIALFLVLTACINFINLATAQAANRAKEIGIRKAIGVHSNQLITQFMIEIALITLIALVFSLAIAELMFIILEDIIGYRLLLDLLHDPYSLIFLCSIFVGVSLISGFYPSVLLAKMNPILALKSKITSKNNSGGLTLRKGLVVFQFAISQFLIIGTLIVTAQMKYFQEKSLGFQSEAIINSYLPHQDEVKRERFREIMMQSPKIAGVTFALSQPTGNSNSHSNFNYAPLQSENSYHANFKACDEVYFDFFGLQLLAGRQLLKTDSTQIVINRKIADLMGFKDKYDLAIGETLNTGWNGDKKIVGVMEDFHTQSLEDPIDYTILLYVPKIFYSFSFKISSVSEIENGLVHFRKTWEEVYPEYVIDYQFYNQELAENYEAEKSIYSLLRIFSLISILIGCLGLYGLISFIAISRTKEIGVRKVLGAPITNILGLFSKEILVLTIIAFIVATPCAYYIMSKWLDGYFYRIELSYGFFALSFVITMLIAMFTISHRTITTAMINPAKTLKDE